MFKPTVKTFEIRNSNPGKTRTIREVREVKPYTVQSNFLKKQVERIASKMSILDYDNLTNAKYATLDVYFRFGVAYRAVATIYPNNS